MVNSKRAYVIDSTPLIYLAKIGRLDILKEVSSEIYIPEAIHNETVTEGKSLNISDAYIIEKAIGKWITRKQVDPRIKEELGFLDSNPKLGTGEKEALMLCKQLKARYLIADDKEARRVSRILKIKPIGTCGILIQAHRQGIIEKEETLQILDDLVTKGFRISISVYNQIRDELNIT